MYARVGSFSLIGPFSSASTKLRQSVAMIRLLFLGAGRSCFVSFMRPAFSAILSAVDEWTPSPAKAHVSHLRVSGAAHCRVTGLKAVAGGGPV